MRKKKQGNSQNGNSYHGKTFIEYRWSPVGSINDGPFYIESYLVAIKKNGERVILNREKGFGLIDEAY